MLAEKMGEMEAVAPKLVVHLQLEERGQRRGARDARSPQDVNENDPYAWEKSSSSRSRRIATRTR